MRIKKKIKILIEFIIISINAIIYSSLTNYNDFFLNQNEFLITFVGLVLGIAITIVTFVFSSIDKIWSIIDSIYGKGTEKSKLVKANFKTAYNELVEDSQCIFIIFVLIILVILIEYVNLDYIFLPFDWKKNILHCFKNIILFSCMIAIIDLFSSLVNILKLAIYENLEE